MNKLWLNDTNLSTPQRSAAVGLLLVQIFAIGLFMEAIAFASCAAIIALTGCLAPHYKLLREFDRTRWFTLTGLLYGLKAVFAPTKFESDLTFVNTELAYEIACYCIVLQLMVLFMKRYELRLPLWTLGVSVIALIFISDIRVSSSRRSYMLATVFLFLFAWSLYAATSRTPVHQTHKRSWFKFLLGSCVLCISLAAGTVISVQLHQHERHLESVLNAYLALADANTAETGFSGRGGLSDVSEWKLVDSQSVALRVTSKNLPGYLRGRVFDTLDKNRWTVGDASARLQPVLSTTIPGIAGADEFLFLVEPSAGNQDQAGEIMRVWPVDGNSAGHFFLPLDSLAVACRADAVHADKYNILMRTDQGDAHPYSVLVDHQSNLKDPSPTSSTTTLPNKIDSRIIAAVDELKLDGKSNRQKMRLVSQFFQKNFQYHLGVRIPRGEDRLGYFISQRVPAHCEYFASATTVMLRMANVPARYVSGYVCGEQNQLDGTWLARRQDAHAWVEAYDDVAQKWIIVESTPAEGVPVPRQAGLQSNFVEWLAHWVRTLQYFVRQGELWSLIWWCLYPLISVLVLSLLVFGFVQILQLFKSRLKLPVASVIAVDPRVQAERQSMDRYIARFGLTREVHEPILRFVQRIQNSTTIPDATKISQWYNHYLQLRFGNDGNVDKSLQQLKVFRKEITSHKPNKKTTASST